MTEVCDDDTARVITHVRTSPAMLPGEHYVDSGYVDVDLLVSSRSHRGVSLEGPVRAMPRRRTEAERAYEQEHFSIDWERQRLTCPQGKTSVAWRAGRGDVGALRIAAVFSRTDCGACAARARMDNPAWRKRYGIRAGIEGTLSQGVRAFACAAAATSARPRPGCSRSARPPHRELAGGNATRQNAHHAVRRSRTGSQNSPAVSHLRRHLAGLRLRRPRH